MISRKDALYRAKIPCLIFLKLKSKCAACESVKPIWEQLTSDPIFKGKLAFVSYSFGVDPVTKKNHLVAPEYQSIVDQYKQVPIFIIHLPDDAGLIDLGFGPNPRTYQSMRETIIRALDESGFPL